MYNRTVAVAIPDVLEHIFNLVKCTHLISHAHVSIELVTNIEYIKTNIESIPVSECIFRPYEVSIIP